MAEVLVTWSLPAESKEFIGPIVVTADGVPVTSFEVAFTDGPAERPTTWSPADIVGSDRGILIGPGTPYVTAVAHKYTVWVRFVDNP